MYLVVHTNITKVQDLKIKKVVFLLLFLYHLFIYNKKWKNLQKNIIFLVNNVLKVASEKCKIRMLSKIKSIISMVVVILVFY